MTFQCSISAVSIANEALSALPADPITSFEERSLEAREIRRFYKSTVARLLELHHWGLATKRVALAALNNDRSGEWGFAYGKPSDMAFPVQMIPNTGAAYTGWYFRDGSYFSLAGRRMFQQVGNTIYSSVEVGMLEYTSFDITEADFTTLFKDIVVLDLAARICPAITKNASRTQTLTAQAELERTRAISNDLNRDQPTYGNRPTESELTRFGGAGCYGGNPIDPVANPAAANTGY